MTSKEDRARALLAAAARHQEVDTGRLWSDAEPELEAPNRRLDGRSRTRLAIAAAAVAIGLVGATLWASNRGDVPTPVASTTSTSTAPTSPSPEPSSTASPTSSAPTPTSTPATTVTPTAQPPLSTRSILVAADYRAAGWVVNSIQASEGWGQSPISSCEEIPGAGGPFGGVFRGDGYATVSGRQLATGQYVLELRSPAEAARMVDTVRSWPEGCAARTHDSVTSSRVRSVRLPGGQQGYWYTFALVQPSGLQHDELIAVTSVGDRVAVVILHEYNASTDLDRVDATELLTRALDRLG